MKTIAIVNNDFSAGGLQRVTSVIGKELSNKYKVLFYALYSKDNFYELDKVYNDSNNKFSRVIRKIPRLLEILVNDGEYTPYKYVRNRLIKLIMFFEKKKVDIVILSGPDLISYIPYLKQKCSNNIKFVAWAHNNFSVYVDRYAKQFKKAFLEGFSTADAAICLTEVDRKKFIHYNKRTYKIYNPLTIKNNKLSNLQTKNISFTGRLAFEHKGIDLLIEIAKKLNEEWTITIAGSGTKKEKKKLFELIKKYSLEDKIIYRGLLKDEDLITHYLYSSMYIMTSRWEGFGLVLTEAMSFGLPIIAFKQSGSEEVLENGKYGVLVENGNIEEFSIRLNQLISNKYELEKLSKLSLKRAKDFNVNTIVKKWLYLLNEI
ncbi:glycosyltransferase [Enterococcus hirae]|uniref:glycosyltransferase n=1 Tax=Enterococcus TaxID=1350 RepID=UPI002542A5C2|nr:glycosyltransferase [Enterococcus hirae]MDK4469187.1 glycosyltransferase [Enterococcus hirae]